VTFVRPAAATSLPAVNTQGRYLLGQGEMAADQLEAALCAEAARQPQRRLHIRGDRTVAYGHVASAMAAAQRSGLKQVGFVTQSGRP
jgi:biopolymer transport protein ExbD